ncbi:uncharacterized protein OCT59_027435 [Rhizophagus irregularis]|uniref:uncharacterized protein n=1 Tax=Rhizophagus irregularis TaxID=588596 RepID=UPI00331F6D63|nr:hypothetical protein OCT59_027435 [Rhizophagus irregularis]
MKGKGKTKGENESEWERKKEYFFKIRSGGLLTNGKPRFVSFGWVLLKKENQKTKIPSSGGLPKNENPKILSSGGLLKNENPKIRSDRLLKNENPKIKIRSGGLLCGKTKIRSGSGGLLTFGKSGTKIPSSWLPIFRKVEPRFVSPRCLGCLLKNGKNQRFVSSGGLLKNNQIFVYTNT